MSNPTELPDRVKALRAALKQISETRFGYEGDCGVTSIADDALSADDEAARRAKPEGEAPQAEPARMNTDESREYLIKFMEQHFTDKTYHRYIRGEHPYPIAGDFAWQMARALRMLERAPAASLSPLCGAQHAESGKEAAAAMRVIGGQRWSKEAEMTEGWIVAQQAAAPGALDADEMTRLRRLMAALGHADAFELTDDYVRGILFTLLGQAAGKLERATNDSERANWTTKQWYEHVGAWETPEGHIAFGSVMALGAMLAQFQRAHRPPAASSAPGTPEAPDEFERGYFCAVSTLLNEDGDSAYARSVFTQGGDPLKADPMDIERFIEHGLMTLAAQLDGCQEGSD